MISSSKQLSAIAYIYRIPSKENQMNDWLTRHRFFTYQEAETATTKIQCIDILLPAILPTSSPRCHYPIFRNHRSEKGKTRILRRCKVGHRFRLKSLWAEIRALRANTRKARNDTATEPVAMLGNASLPQFDTQSSVRAVAEDDEEIKRYASICNQQ